MAYPQHAEPHGPSPRSIRRAVAVGLVIGVPASIVFLWLAFRNVNAEAVRDAASRSALWLVAVGIVAIGGVYLFQAERWRRIAATSRPNTGGFLEMVVGGIACNNVLPGRLGEFFRARWLAVEASVPWGRAFATVGLDRGC